MENVENILNQMLPSIPHMQYDLNLFENQILFRC